MSTQRSEQRSITERAESKRFGMNSVESETQDVVGSVKSYERFVALLLFAGVVLVSPWRMVDPDALSNLAIGRIIVEQRGVPDTDPLTFSAPKTRWSNPEWLGDLIWYTTYRIGGEHAIVALKLFLCGMAWILALRLGTRLGASPLLVSGLLLFALVGSVGRFTLRNHIHAYWLIPLYGLILLRAKKNWRWLLALVPLSIVWVNLHSSFVFAWLLVFAAFVDELLHKNTASPQNNRTSRIALSTLLLVQPLLALVNPHGVHVFDQLWDHLRGADVYRATIVEWGSSQASTGLEILPLHVIGILGLLSFLPRPNRKRLQGLLLFGVGLFFAHISRRFVPVFLILAIPQVAANLWCWLAAKSVEIRRWSVISTIAIALALLIPVIWIARTQPQTHVLERQGGPVLAARFLAEQAPLETRLFNPYNAGPWLLWEVTPRVQIFIDPRNNLGAKSLYRYLKELLPKPDQFEQEVERSNISMAMTDLSDGRMSVLNRHLDDSRKWDLVYLDGTYAIFAHVEEKNAELRRKYTYQIVKAQLDLEYLLDAPSKQLQIELRRVKQQGPNLASAIHGYRLLADFAIPPALPRFVDKETTTRAKELLSGALPKLPPSPALMTYLATAFARLGDRNAYDEVIQTAVALFPKSPHVLAIQAIMTRASGENMLPYLDKLRQQLDTNHPLWRAVVSEQK
ncbi:MAG: hypothetical protein V1754_05565 [Pseudomonadota bacterium]